MLEEKTSNQIERNPGKEKVLSWEQLRQDVMYPFRRDILQATDISWDSKKPEKGAWRQYLTKNRLVIPDYLMYYFTFWCIDVVPV